MSTLLDKRLAQIDTVTSIMKRIQENLSMENTYAEMSCSQTTIRNETVNLDKIFKRPVAIFRFKPSRKDVCVGHSSEAHPPHQRKYKKDLGYLKCYLKYSILALVRGNILLILNFN